MIFLRPTDYQEPEKNEDDQDELSEGAIKDNVRKRDGYKCRDCGMAYEQHVKKHQQTLEVHRLLPGLVYSEHHCVTLCVDCHNKKPRRIQQAMWCEDLRWLIFNLYDEEDALLYRALQAHATATKLSFAAAVVSLLREKMEALVAHDKADLLMQTDGLW